MEKIKVGVIGTGFIGPVHIEAIRRQGTAEVIALSEVNAELAARTKQICWELRNPMGTIKNCLQIRSSDCSYLYAEPSPL